MGRGAQAAHAAYNGGGTQGISVTNKINEDEDLISVFINENFWYALNDTRPFTVVVIAWLIGL